MKITTFLKISIEYIHGARKVCSTKTVNVARPQVLQALFAFLKANPCPRRRRSSTIPGEAAFRVRLSFLAAEIMPPIMSAFSQDTKFSGYRSETRNKANRERLHLSRFTYDFIGLNRIFTNTRNRKKKENKTILSEHRVESGARALGRWLKIAAG